MEPLEVVVTGLGVLASNGMGRLPFWKALQEGRSGIRHVQRFDASDLPCQIAGELWDFNPADFMRKSVVKNWHRHVHQAVASSRMAVEDAELMTAGYPGERVAAAFGTSIGSPHEAYQGQVEAYQSGGFRKVSKFASSAFSGHAATVHVSVDFGLRGPAITIASGCATGLDVLAWAYNQLQLGHADAAVVGATESPVFVHSFATACSLGILSQRNNDPEKAMRPFDKHRDGIVLSEGAVALVLERRERAEARGAPILGVLAGTGSASEAANPLILDRQGEALARAMEGAIQHAGLSVREIDHIQAHGVSLEMYDRGETNAYKRAFGEHIYRIPISAVKSMVGQSYSAGGLFGVAAALLALNEGVVAPTVNLEDPDPVCDLDYVPQRARLNDIRTALVTAMSFGGTHSAVVLRQVA
jgi:3-oxoacyl-[acyl-carrier-protein] synthase II